MNKIEKEFYKTFGIGPKELDYPDNFEYYPEITDRILLKILALINDKTLECMKKQILTKVIGIMSDNPYKINQVQSLFRGGEE